MEMEKTIKLGHGSGGRMTHELIERLFLRAFFNPALAPLEDSAEVRAGKERLAFTTDSYVVDPLRFPGADIGRIAVCGTVNDLAVKGAKPLAVSAAFIIEEGFPLALLRKFAGSMKKAAREAGVPIVTGDTKVVEKGKADKLFINTSGVGLIPAKIKLSSASIRPGDAVILSGCLAGHGVAVMNARSRLGLSGGIKSDAAPLNAMIARALRASANIRAIRDITRGGLGTVLNEAALACGASIEINETAVPVKPAVENACRLLGLDPLYVANEGKAVFFAAAPDAAKIVAALRADKYGREARVIGRVLKDNACARAVSKRDPFLGSLPTGGHRTAVSPTYGHQTAKKPQVRLNTAIGGTRLVMMLEGEQLPRIC